MLEHLTGRDGALWEVAPAMGLVLLASAPSGKPQIVQVRDEILDHMPSPKLPNTGCLGLPSISPSGW